MRVLGAHQVGLERMCDLKGKNLLWNSDADGNRPNTRDICSYNAKTVWGEVAGNDTDKAVLQSSKEGENGWPRPRRELRFCLDFDCRERTAEGPLGVEVHCAPKQE